MWFDLDLFGNRKKQLRKLNAAILLAGRMRDSLKAAQFPSSAFMAAVQIRSLLDLVDDDLRNALEQEKSPFKAAVQDSLEWVDNNSLNSALAALQDILEGKRAVLLEPLGGGHDPRNRDDDAGGKKDEVEGEAPAKPAPVDEPSVLWAVTEKLYASWQVRAIAVVVGLAIAIATGGSFIIAGQTLNVRQNLDNAQEKAQTEIKAISEATQSRVAKESESLFGRLHERGQDIEKAQDRAQAEIKAISEATQSRVAKESESLLGRLHERGLDINAQMQKAEQEVVNLNAGSEKIKTDIMKRLQDDLGTQASSLRVQIIKPLEKIRDKDLSDISDVLAEARKKLDKLNLDIASQQGGLGGIGPKLELLRGYADRSDKIANALSTIVADQDAARKGRTSIEAEAYAAMSQRKAAESSALEAEKQKDRVGAVVKNASDETQKHNRTLAVVERQLNEFDGNLKELNRKLNESVAAEELRLKTIRGRIDALDETAKPLPPKPPAATPVVSPTPLVDIPESDLTLDDKKRIQRGLAMAGLRVDKFDGKFGKQTLAAIKAYQAKLNAPVTGHLTPEQIRTLLNSPDKRT